MSVDVVCTVACGLCCEDHGFHCPHLGREGCTFARTARPPGCNRYLCSIGKAVHEGRLTLKEARAMKAWDRENERNRTEID